MCWRIERCEHCRGHSSRPSDGTRAHDSDAALRLRHTLSVKNVQCSLLEREKLACSDLACGTDCCAPECFRTRKPFLNAIWEDSRASDNLLTFKIFWASQSRGLSLPA